MTVKKLLKKYHDECHCRGDQYGSWGPCELCKEYQKLTSQPRSDHVCGLQGFNGMLGDTCPGCDRDFEKT
jgi:hypothetical protein